MSKKQALINNEITQLVQQKVTSGSPWTLDEVKRAQLFSGAGGVTTGVRGSLYEFYTPDYIVASMWAMAYKHGFKNGKILEPSCGTGNFLRYVDPTNNFVDAYEYSKDDDTGYQIAKATYPFVNIKKDHFESIFYQGNTRVGSNKKYDLVIGNPPYGKFSGTYAGKAREGKHFTGVTYDQYFIWAAIELLEKNGLCIMIIPSKFLENATNYEAFKDDIYSRADLVDAFRLPRSTFTDTQTQPDIVVFKKR
tara:strand:- start:14952 stop:15701 length:750 start_codon:yes stop_codon:yes gene_type:complete